MRAALVGVVSVAVAVLAALPASAPAVAVCDSKRKARPHRDRSRAVAAPLILGDSTMLLAVPYLAARGIQADARACRPLIAGVDMLSTRQRARRLPTVAVLALGSNGPVGDDEVDRALRIAGPGRVLGLVTPARAGSGSASAMRRAARRHPERVVLIDWMGFSHRRGGIFGGDGLHVSDRGARVFAAFVRRRLEPFFPPRALRVPLTGGTPCGSAGAVEVLVLRGAERVSCARARALSRAHALAGIRGWRYYDWRRGGRRPWNGVYVRRDRRIIVVTRAAARAARAARASTVKRREPVGVRAGERATPPRSSPRARTRCYGLAATPTRSCPAAWT